MKILKYSDYAEYREAQIAANKQKFRNIFVEDAELREIAKHYTAHGSSRGRGICHGVRNGYEIQVLNRLLPQSDIIGTDISETVTSVPNCIVWDMHEVKPDWIESMDFMYSNSWDHSYDPYLLFSRWSECLSARGLLYLAYTEKHGEGGVTEESKYDAFGCSLDELIGILRKYFVIDDILVVQPRISKHAIWRRLSHLRARNFRKSMSVPISGRRTHVLALRRRAGNGNGAQGETASGHE